MMTSKLTALQSAGELTARVDVGGLRLEGTRYTHDDQVNFRCMFFPGLTLP
jgi:hypothetical protein